MTESKILYVLDDRRVELGYTIKALSEEMGISTNTISHWFNGIAKPSLRDIVKMAKILSCEIKIEVGEMTDEQRIKAEDTKAYRAGHRKD